MLDRENDALMLQISFLFPSVPIRAALCLCRVRASAGGRGHPGRQSELRELGRGESRSDRWHVSQPDPRGPGQSEPHGLQREEGALAPDLRPQPAAVQEGG